MNFTRKFCNSASQIYYLDFLHNSWSRKISGKSAKMSQYTTHDSGRKVKYFRVPTGGLVSCCYTYPNVTDFCIPWLNDECAPVTLSNFSFHISVNLT